jgi:hypothetical protein
VATIRKGKSKICSMDEFRARYFTDEPKRRVIIDTPEKARAWGVEMAREAMKNLKTKSQKVAPSCQ